MNTRAHHKSSSHSQIHMAIISLDPSQQLVIISDVDQNLRVAFDGFVEDAEGSWF